MAKRILIVEDELESLKLTGLVLERRGYEIIAAQTGVKALEKAQSQHPDLIILDIMMPDLDGYEICRRLRANPSTAELPIIMFTAKTALRDKVTGFEAGADDYLTKPVHPEELASRVAALLQRFTRTGEETEAERAKIIGILGSKGGLGTTTLAVNLAIAMAQGPAQDQEIALMETRSGLAAASLQMEIRPGGIKRLLKQPAGRIDAELMQAQIAQHGTGVRLLSGQTAPPGVAEPISADHADALVRHLGAMADHLLLDLGVGLEDVNRRLLPRCHRVLVTIEPNRIALTLAQDLLTTLNRSLNIPTHKANLVLINKSRSATTFTKDTIESLLQHDIIGVITPAPELAFQSAEKGIPMVMLQPKSLVSQQFRTLASSLVQE